MNSADRLKLSMEERLELHMNDQGNAARLLSVHGEDLIFVNGRGWAVWNGSCYSLAKGDLGALELAYQLPQIVLDEVEYIEKYLVVSPSEIRAMIKKCARKRPPVNIEDDEEGQKKARFLVRQERAEELRKFAVRCGQLRTIKTALECCQHQRRTEVIDMDQDPWSFICANGQIDLRKVAQFRGIPWDNSPEIITEKWAWLGPVNRAALPSRASNITFDPEAECPKWMTFLELIVPDNEIRLCLQRALGGTLFGENREQACLMLRGQGGNGKSTLLNIIAHVLGYREGYAETCNIETFIETPTSSAASHNQDEVDLPGSRVIIATEPSPRDTLSSKKVKSMTGGDTKKSRQMHDRYFRWVPRAVPLISFNRMPRIKDEDEGTRRRFIFFPFPTQLRNLPPEQQRSQGEVEAELKKEAPGILNWLLEGFSEFIERGIDPTPAMRNLKEQLLEAADPVGVFIKEAAEKSEGARLGVSEFYNAYSQWSESNGYACFKPRSVREIMIEKGYEPIKSNGLSCWKDLKLTATGGEFLSMHRKIHNPFGD